MPGPYQDSRVPGECEKIACAKLAPRRNRFPLPPNWEASRRRSHSAETGYMHARAQRLDLPLSAERRSAGGPGGGSVNEGGERGGYVYSSEGAEAEGPAVVEFLPEAVRHVAPGQLFAVVVGALVA